MLAERPLIALEAEHGVLGGLMHEPSLCEDVGAFLGAEDFGNECNGALYSLILGCHSRQVSPDPISLSEIRSELPNGDSTFVYAVEIMRNVSGSSNVKHFAGIIRERSKARQLYQAANEIMNLAMSTGTIAQQISAAQAMMMDLSAEEETPDVVTMRQALGPVFDDMEERRAGTQVMGEDFGLADLDKIVKTLRPGNLVIIAGRPGTGKTVLGTGIADRVAIKGGSSLIFSLEMPTKELAKRSLAAQAGVSQEMIETGLALEDDDASARLTVAVAKLADADVRICDKGALTFARICSIARFQNRAKKLSLIVVDYLSLIATDPSSKLQNRNLELGSYTRGFKALAKELGIPVIVLAQLNRSIENRADPKPKMSDLRDSGEIEQDADVIIMAHRDNDADRGGRGITDVDVVKVRHAQPRDCVLQFQGEFARFVNADHSAYAREYAEQPPAARPSARSMMGSFRGGRA